MPRLEGKNILMIIPKDYYEEDQLEIPKKIFKEEGAKVYVASSKLKEAVGMKSGRHMPDLLIVDAIEGITGDSYVTSAKGTRQIKGIFHGTVVVGGSGTRKYLWKEKLVRLLLTDRFRAHMVVGAIGTAVPCLGEAGLLENIEVAAEQNKHTLPELDQAAAILVDDDLRVHDRLITARDSSVAEKFAWAMVDAVAQTAIK